VSICPIDLIDYVPIEEGRNFLELFVRGAFRGPKVAAKDEVLEPENYDFLLELGDIRDAWFIASGRSFLVGV